jgi:hypothetical protein
MPTNTYTVKFKLEGGATVTKDIVASHEGDAAVRAIRKFKAKEVLSIRKKK